ncbi:MAG: hypothetical protein LC791_11600 [Acidobacteria bacterium]|nr:hypothetical protein [Acidobacteriota bacterium]
MILGGLALLAALGSATGIVTVRAHQSGTCVELNTDLSAARAPLLNDPKTTALLVNANAVIGVVAKDTNKDGTIDITTGDKMGVSCAFRCTSRRCSRRSSPLPGQRGHDQQAR